MVLLAAWVMISWLTWMAIYMFCRGYHAMRQHAKEESAWAVGFLTVIASVITGFIASVGWLFLLFE